MILINTHPKRVLSQSILAVLFILFTQFVFSQTPDPKADPSAMILCGNARFTVLTPSMLRLEWNKNAEFNNQATMVFINRKMPVPLFSKKESNDSLVITTEELSLIYLKNKGKFNSSNLRIIYKVDSTYSIWMPGMKDSLNLKGTTTTLDGANGYEGVTLGEGLISRSGWAFVDDTGSPLFNDSTLWVENGREDGSYDGYFFGYGHRYKQALYDFTMVAGKIPMVPRWVFGYWWSRYWTYSDDELRDLTGSFRFYRIPADVLVIDMDWHETFGLSSHGLKVDEFFQRPGWTGYTWNRTLFPEPGKFLDWTKSENLKVALNIHPASGIAPMEEKYAEFAKEYHLDICGSKNIPFKIEEKKWVDTWFKVVLHPLEKQGVDIWWLDWQQWRMNKGIRNLTNVWWLNHVFYNDKVKNESIRPFVFHRYGGLGNHRYPVGFSGDTYSTWKSLEYQPYFTATAANVGYDYWSHDIGGHFGSAGDAELFLRWIQLGVFSPMLRTHSTKTTILERRIWKYPDHFEDMRNAFLLRYSLIPYIYNASRKTYDSAVALCRPLYHDYPGKNEAYIYKTEYMFGEDILVAPVTQRTDANGLALKNIWLPGGTWYEWCSGTLLNGNAIIQRDFLQDEIPFYAREGAIIPMYINTYNLQVPNDTLCLWLIPGDFGSLNYYEDDGISQGYKKGHYTLTKIEKRVIENNKTEVLIHPSEGQYEGAKAEKRYILMFPCSYAPEKVIVNNKEYSFSKDVKNGSWTYNVKELSLEVVLPLMPVNVKIKVEIFYKMPVSEMNKQLSGMKGNFHRMAEATQLIKNEVNRVDQIANAPSLVLKAASIPTLISYDPWSAENLLPAYHVLMVEMYKQLSQLKRVSKVTIEKTAQLIPYLHHSIAGKPLIKLSSRSSSKPVRVRIKPAKEGGIVRFTLDGTEPSEDSPLYTGEFNVNRTCVIRAAAFSKGLLPGYVAADTFHLKFAKETHYHFPYSDKYTGNAKDALTDGKFASPYDFSTKWIGFEGTDMVADITLCTRRRVDSVTMRFLNDQNSWIFLPVKIILEVSSDGRNYMKVFEKNNQDESNKTEESCRAMEYHAAVNMDKIKYMRIRAVNMGKCPEWHKGNGNKCWLFTDELILK